MGLRNIQYILDDLYVLKQNCVNSIIYFFYPATFLSTDLFGSLQFLPNKCHKCQFVYVLATCPLRE